MYRARCQTGGIAESMTWREIEINCRMGKEIEVIVDGEEIDPSRLHEVLSS